MALPIITEDMRLFFVMLLVASGPLHGFEEGLASWYGGKFQGRLTANGEIFDTNQLSAAHRSLPFGTIVKVTNLENGSSIEVRINDRGPFIEDRIIDLSRAAADALGMTKRGVAPVRLEMVKAVDGQLRYHIQVGAFRVADNARRARLKMESQGLEVLEESTQDGITRILAADVAEEELEEVMDVLRRTGFKSFLLRQIKAPAGEPTTPD
jgi:rare lipoprotein A